MIFDLFSFLDVSVSSIQPPHSPPHQYEEENIPQTPHSMTQHPPNTQQQILGEIESNKYQIKGLRNPNAINAYHQNLVASLGSLVSNINSVVGKINTWKIFKINYHNFYAEKFLYDVVKKKKIKKTNCVYYLFILKQMHHYVLIKIFPIHWYNHDGIEIFLG